jgi:hypothetical protein
MRERLVAGSAWSVTIACLDAERAVTVTNLALAFEPHD